MPATTFEAVEAQKLREAAEQSEILDIYCDLVRDIATGNTVETNLVSNACRAAGKSAADLEADVREFHKAKSDEALRQRAIDHKAIRQRAQMDLVKLTAKKAELEESLRQCQRDISQRQQIIDRDAKMQSDRALAEGRLVDRCRDHRKTQYLELGEWMKENSRQRVQLDAERNETLGQIRRAQNDLAAAGENPEIQMQIADLEAEANQLGEKIESLKLQWEEARADKQALREAMFTP